VAVARLVRVRDLDQHLGSRPPKAALATRLRNERAARDLEGRQPPLEFRQIAGAEASIDGAGIMQ